MGQSSKDSSSSYCPSRIWSFEIVINKVKSRTVKKITIIILLSFYLVVLNSCNIMSNQNYNNPNGPVYTGEYAGDSPSYDGRIKVVTWNLRHGEQVEKAIQTLQEANDLQDADILLMQEMDEIGVEQIAQALSYNYVFYPAIYNTHHKKTQGNAILTKWPILSHAKIILPKFATELMQTRISVKATILIDNAEVDVYNEHLELLWLLPLKINYQADFLARQINPNRMTIVAGDFNSWNDLVIAYLEKLFNEIGLIRVSAGAGYTFKTRGLQLTLDHIFASEEKDYQAGVWRDTDASDHYPLWADLEMVELSPKQ